MAGFLLAMIACFGAEAGGRSQHLFSELRAASGGTIITAIAWLIAVLVNIGAIALVAGVLIRHINADARTMFMAMMFCAAGCTLFASIKRVPSYRTAKLLPLVIVFLLRGLGEASQLILSGIGVGFGNPALAAFGGLVGIASAAFFTGNNLMPSVTRHVVAVRRVMAFLLIGGATSMGWNIFFKG